MHECVSMNFFAGRAVVGGQRERQWKREKEEEIRQNMSLKSKRAQEPYDACLC